MLKKIEYAIGCYVLINYAPSHTPTKILAQIISQTNDVPLKTKKKILSNQYPLKDCDSEHYKVEIIDHRKAVKLSSITGISKLKDYCFVNVDSSGYYLSPFFLQKDCRLINTTNSKYKGKIYKLIHLKYDPEQEEILATLKQEAHFESGSPFMDIQLFNLTLNYGLLE